VTGNHIEVVELLVSRNADVNATTFNGSSVMQIAEIGVKLTQVFTRAKIKIILRQAGAT
jgi:hypothetical protein